ncbi:hypothetical protein MSAN_02456900 [Mycena sanguinolenta]|uniref:Uncharacterized protein n=1 Tax=Mycena sanguinolenta TaxID=230812 RepID=A0A8H6WXT2_9AGAR|nr:hypothetical protein MSAN_02456900 [Mycena sanguinolenta]
MLRACFGNTRAFRSATSLTAIRIGFRGCSTHAASFTPAATKITTDKTYTKTRANTNKMGKNNKKKSAPPPELFHIVHPASSPSSRAIVDTHTHLASTFDAYSSG